MIPKGMEDYYNYLERLRRSGETNMFGAAPYLMDEFMISKNRAVMILSNWMKDYSREDYKDLED